MVLRTRRLENRDGLEPSRGQIGGERSQIGNYAQLTECGLGLVMASKVGRYAKKTIFRQHK